MLLLGVSPGPRARVGWRRASVSLVLAWAVVGAALIASPPAVAQLSSSPFDGTALWVGQAPAQSGVQELEAKAASAGVHTLFVKAADGSTVEPQFSSTLVHSLQTAGVRVCAWTFAYGISPLKEAAAALTAVRDGAQCLIVDAEGQYDGRYGPAQLFVRTLRAGLGKRFPIALAGQAEVTQHPTFPYSVFLGPGAFDFDLPQMYWLELGTSVDATYAATLGINSIYGRPILPVGQIFGPPSLSELTHFRSLAGAYGAPGLSFFDLDAAEAPELTSLAVAAPRLARRVVIPPTIHAGADGDEVLWAQELLNAAGARLPVGGFFGAQTSRAIAYFQARHRLPANGVLGPATWRALMKLRPHEPSWAKRAPDSALISGG